MERFTNKRHGCIRSIRFPADERTALQWVNMLAEYEDTNLTPEQIAALTARIAELEEAARWVPVGERLPTAEDADQYGSVSLWSPDTGIDLCAWADVCMMGWATHWRRPDAPKGEQL